MSRPATVMAHDFFAGQADSDYYQGASAFLAKTTIKIYVEAFDDVVLWEKILNHAKQLANVVDLSAIGDLTGSDGKDKVLQQAPSTGPHLLLCVDSDYDFIAREFREQSRLINNHPFIFQTYCYSLENFFCEPTQLSSCFTQATKCTAVEGEQSIVDIFQRIGEVALEPLLMMLFLLKENSSGFVFKDYQQRLLSALSFVGMTQDIPAKLQQIDQHMALLMADLTRTYTTCFAQGFVDWKNEIAAFFVDHWHLIIRGHDLFDKMVKPIAKQVCANRLRQQIQALGQRPGTDKVDKIKQYRAAIVPAETLIKQRIDFENTLVFDHIVADFVAFFDQYQS